MNFCASAIQRHDSRRLERMSVHSSSVVEDGAVIGAGVEIGPFCHVGARAVLGEVCACARMCR